MRTVIVGGGACGASCAARLRRLDESAEIIILEATDEISIANCGLPYYCSGVISDRDQMIVAPPSQFKNLFNIEVRLNSKVTSINRTEKSVTINNDYRLKYDNLVLALGASPFIPPIDGINNKKNFTVRTLRDTDRIKDYISKTPVKNAVIAGGGFIGIEMAEAFIKLGINTTIVESGSQILAPFDSDMIALAHNELRKNGCKLIFSDGVKSFSDNEVELISGQKLPYDIGVISIGVRPDTEVALNAGLAAGIGNTIKTNEYMQTSDSSIWAGGDSVEVLNYVTGQPAVIPLAGPANRQGRIIADNIAAQTNPDLKPQKYKNSLGTSVIKVFDMTFASTGCNEKQLKSAGIKYLKNIVKANDHAGYYPGATHVVLKLLFTSTGKILGAQAAGLNGAEKRIDVISTVMRLGGTVQDLIDSELCYAPPYSSAKDVVNLAGMSSKNILDGLFKPAFFEDITEDVFLVDVRSPELYQKGWIKDAVSIPSTDIRERYNEIPKDRKIILYCRRGYNSYVAARILTGYGYTNVYSLCGGKSLYDELLQDTLEEQPVLV